MPLLPSLPPAMDFLVPKRDFRGGHSSQSRPSRLRLSSCHRRALFIASSLVKMTFRPDGSVERSNDLRVLGPHKNEDDDRDPYSYRVLMARRVGTGRVIPTKFTPPNANDTPSFLFTRDEEIPRFIRRTDASQFLIYADGACLGNGGSKARAGCSFVFRPSSVNPRVCGWTQFPLETEGPTGEGHPQTSNRAELRAVIAALRFRYWPGEGCRSLVIATDSEYVAEGITIWVQAWLRNGWKTSAGVPVKNQDLWKCLLGEVEWWHDNGMAVRFWRIQGNGTQKRTNMPKSLLPRLDLAYLPT